MDDWNLSIHWPSNPHLLLPAEPIIFLRICTQTLTISSDLCPPLVFKLRAYIQKLCNVYYPPTPSFGWIGQIKCLSLSLASAQSAFWLVYSMHPRSLTLIWSWMQVAQNRTRHARHDGECGDLIFSASTTREYWIFQWYLDSPAMLSSRLQWSHFFPYQWPCMNNNIAPMGMGGHGHGHPM